MEFAGICQFTRTRLAVTGVRSRPTCSEIPQFEPTAIDFSAAQQIHLVCSAKEAPRETFDNAVMRLVDAVLICSGPEGAQMNRFVNVGRFIGFTLSS